MGKIITIFFDLHRRISDMDQFQGVCPFGQTNAQPIYIYIVLVIYIYTIYRLKALDG